MTQQAKVTEKGVKLDNQTQSQVVISKESGAKSQTAQTVSAKIKNRDLITSESHLSFMSNGEDTDANKNGSANHSGRVRSPVDGEQAQSAFLKLNVGQIDSHIREESEDLTFR